MGEELLSRQKGRLGDFSGPFRLKDPMIISRGHTQSDAQWFRGARRVHLALTQCQVLHASSGQALPPAATSRRPDWETASLAPRNWVGSSYFPHSQDHTLLHWGAEIGHRQGPSVLGLLSISSHPSRVLSSGSWGSCRFLGTADYVTLSLQTHEQLRGHGQHFIHLSSAHQADDHKSG